MLGFSVANIGSSYSSDREGGGRKNSENPRANVDKGQSYVCKGDVIILRTFPHSKEITQVEPISKLNHSSHERYWKVKVTNIY